MNRLGRILDEQQSVEQAEFRHKYNTLDNIQINPKIHRI